MWHFTFSRSIIYISIDYYLLLSSVIPKIFLRHFVAMYTPVQVVIFFNLQEDLAMELRNSKEIFDMEEGDAEGRMVLEITDYPPTRSNPIHDPRSPGHP